jgi:hypothetical protein
MHEMQKGYLARWKQRKKRGEEHVVDYWFSFRPENAAVWETRQAAESDCTAIFNHFGIDILSENGSTYFCKSFVVEERGPQEFLVCCNAPFHSISPDEESRGRTP